VILAVISLPPNGNSTVLKLHHYTTARVRALAAYNDFLTLRKDADTDVPILKEATAEYAKLQ
jgi:hypothetical protein